MPAQPRVRRTILGCAVVMPKRDYARHVRRPLFVLSVTKSPPARCLADKFVPLYPYLFFSRNMSLSSPVDPPCLLPKPYAHSSVARAACFLNPVAAAPAAAAAAAAPVHQATHYYREGRYTSCSDCWKDFKTAISAKMCKDEAEAQVSRRRIPIPQSLPLLKTTAIHNMSTPSHHHDPQPPPPPPSPPPPNHHPLPTTTTTPPPPPSHNHHHLTATTLTITADDFAISRSAACAGTVSTQSQFGIVVVLVYTAIALVFLRLF